MKFPLGFCVTYSAAGHLMKYVLAQTGMCSEKAERPLKGCAQQVTAKKGNHMPPFVTKSINMPRTSWHIRHETMMGI